MSKIVCNILNAACELDSLIELIHASFNDVVPIVETDFGLDEVDVIFISASKQTIPEWGVGGNTPGPNHVYISLDPESRKLSKEFITRTLYHEFHHAKRWKNPGYGDTLGAALITEGLACLYETEKSGSEPIYVLNEPKQEQIDLARLEIENTEYDHGKWIYGSGEIDRWFGYAYGYRLCKNYAESNNKTALEMVDIDSNTILKEANL